MNSLKIILLILSYFLMMVGCAEQRILERISLTTLIGYDLAEEDQVTATAVIRQINPDLESKVEVQSETEATSKGTRIKVDLKTSKKIGAGQLRVALFGENLAKAGLNDTIHTLKMNPEISNAIYLAVVEGEVKTLIDNNYKNITDIGQHVFQLIEHNIEQQHSISSTLHEINRDNLSELADFAMPMLKRNGEFIGISNIAFFKEGKMVGKLPIGDAFYIMMIRDHFKYGTLELALPAPTLVPSTAKNDEKEFQVAIDSIKSSRKNTLVDRTTPEFNLTINLECRLLEIHSSVSTSNPKTVETLEKEMNKKIESEISRVIRYSQEINSDIFGFGERYKAEVRNAAIDKEKWHEMYPNMKVNVTVNSRILRDGVFQ